MNNNNNNNNNKRNRIPRGYLPEDSDRRLDWLKSEHDFELKNLPPNKTEELKGIIENHVGFMQMPMAIAGPAIIDGKYAKGEFTIPLCTIEGSLAASMNRGLYASSL
jgi:hydroxymethylglutaryl-CoA reductase (NADPH)